jgi:hypothetical protein
MSDTNDEYSHLQMQGLPFDFPDVRDQFAMAAVTGIMSNNPVIGRHQVAEWAYEIADAMMEKRTENNDGTEDA